MTTTKHHPAVWEPTPGVGALARGHETRNPANDWLAARFAARRALLERLAAGGWALQYVRGGLGPQDPAERDRAVQALLKGPGENRVDLAVAYLRGWVEHHPATSGPCECWITDPSTWFYYGSAVEPGSQMEWNPDCPMHGQEAEPGPVWWTNAYWGIPAQENR